MPDETIPRHCWICGKVADSREHQTKKSHLKAVFEDVSEEKKIHYRSAKEKTLINRLDHLLVLFKKVICHECNNERTQASDKAWERLFKYFDTNCWDLKKGESLNLRRVSPIGLRSR